MKNQITLPNQYSFPYNEIQENVFNIENGLDVEIPGVFTYKNKEGKKITLYLGENNEYYTIKGEKKSLGENIELVAKKERITRVDLLNFKGLDDIGIEILINNSLNIDINTQEGIDKLNSLFIDGISFIEELGRSLPEKYNDDNFFSTKEEIIMFCKETTKKGKRKAYINCLISKGIYIVADIINNEGRVHLKERSQFIINKYIGNRSEFTMITNHKGYLTLGKRKIPFSFSYRYKSDKSANYKVAKDPQYSSSTSFFDDIGIHFYTKNKEDSILLHDHMNKIVCGNDINYDIENKKFYGKSDLEGIEDRLSHTFSSKLENNIGDKRPGTNSDYSEAKTKTKINVPKKEDLSINGAIGDNLGFEMIFDLFNSKNEKGLSFHPVYAYYKLFEIMFRFYHGFIGEVEIDFIIDLFFKKLPDNIKEKNKLILEGEEKTIDDYFIELEDDLDGKGFLSKSNSNRKAKETELKIALKKYYLSKLLKVKIDGRRGEFYSNSREYNLSLVGFRKKMTILQK